jgi:hypothetical protein
VERFIWLSVVILAFFRVNKEVSFVLPIFLGLLCHVIIGYKLLNIHIPPVTELLSCLKGSRNSKNFAIGSILTDLASLDSNLVVAATNAATGGSYILGQRFKNQLIMGYAVFATRIRNSIATKDQLTFFIVLKKEKYLIYINTFAILALLPFSFYFADDILGPTYLHANLVLTLIFANGILVGLSYILIDILNFAGFARKLSLNFFPLVPVQLLAIFLVAREAGLLAATFALLVTSLAMSLRLISITRQSFHNYFKPGPA